MVPRTADRLPSAGMAKEVKKAIDLDHSETNGPLTDAEENAATWIAVVT